MISLFSGSKSQICPLNLKSAALLCKASCRFSFHALIDPNRFRFSPDLYNCSFKRSGQTVVVCLMNRISDSCLLCSSVKDFGANEIRPLFTRALVRPSVTSGDQTSQGLEALHRLVHNFDQTVWKLVNKAASNRTHCFLKDNEVRLCDQHSPR